jgi:hypothetical protein
MKLTCKELWDQLWDSDGIPSIPEGIATEWERLTFLGKICYIPLMIWFVPVIVVALCIAIPLLLCILPLSDQLDKLKFLFYRREPDYSVIWPRR